MWKEINVDDLELDKILSMDETFGCGRYAPLLKEDYQRIMDYSNSKLLYYEDETWQCYMYLRKHDGDEFFVSHRQSLKWDFTNLTIKPFQFLPIIAAKTKELLKEYGCPMKYLRFTAERAETFGDDAITYKAELDAKWTEEYGDKDSSRVFVKQYYNSIGMDIEFFTDYDMVSLL